jgi:transcriptional regulator with XRE-family HTH domain
LVAEKLGWSQSELGRRLGVSQGQARNYLTGTSSPPFEMLEKIEEVTGVAAADLFRSDRAPEPNVVRHDLAKEIELAVGESTKANAKLIDEFVQKLGPVLASLNRDHGVEEIVVRKASKDKLGAFVNRILRAPGVSADFYRLLDEGTKDGPLMVEFLRSLNEGVLSADGSEAAELRKVLKTLLR